MARLSNTGVSSSVSDPTAINLNRMLLRLQGVIMTPDSETESRLHSSPLERKKVGTNLQHARTLLLRLEQDALNIKVQSKKQETQLDLIRKREVIERLAERLQEYNELGSFEEDADTSEGEDLLGEETPSETDVSHTSEHPENTPPVSLSSSLSPLSPHLTQSSPPLPHDVEPEPEPVSTLRARNPRAELFALSASSTGRESTGISTATTEALLTHNRTEQESLTSSLLNMAQQLKASSQSFATSLEDEKGILDGATKGLDKSELGMEAAQKRMGYLRSMTEGRGWFGRMLMYAWIAGLMVLALVIVFVLPKLRF